EVAEIAFVIEDAAIRDPLELERRDREALGDLGSRGVDLDVLAQPGDGDLHARTAARAGGRFPRTCAGPGSRGGASRSARARARTRSRRTPRGRSRRSR